MPSCQPGAWDQHGRSRPIIGVAVWYACEIAVYLHSTGAISPTRRGWLMLRSSRRARRRTMTQPKPQPVGK